MDEHTKDDCYSGVVVSSVQSWFMCGDQVIAKQTARAIGNEEARALATHYKSKGANYEAAVVLWMMLAAQWNASMSHLYTGHHKSNPMAPFGSRIRNTTP